MLDFIVWGGLFWRITYEIEKYNYSESFYKIVYSVILLGSTIALILRGVYIGSIKVKEIIYIFL
jgi:hypothetical protein